MNVRLIRMSLILGILFFLFQSQHFPKTVFFVKLLELTEQDKIEKYLECIIIKNKLFLRKLCVHKFERKAQNWLKRYLKHERSRCNLFSANISGCYYLQNVHPCPGNELCIETDEGLLIVGLDGKLLGEIRYPVCQTFMSRVAFIDLDPEGDSTHLQEVIVKGSQIDTNEHSTMYILKWIDNEYEIVLQKQLRESLAARGVVHALLEHIGFALIEEKLLLRINDEGVFEYYSYADGLYISFAERNK